MGRIVLSYIFGYTKPYWWEHSFVLVGSQFNLVGSLVYLGRITLSVDGITTGFGEMALNVKSGI